MKYLRQFCIIIGFSFAGELLHLWVPLPIPASVYGMVLLFAALMLGLVKPEQVRETGQLLVGIMSVLFVCPAVGMLKYWQIIRQNLAAVSVIIVVSLVVTFFVAGHVTQLLNRRQEAKEHV